LRAAGVEQQRLRDETGAMFVVADVHTRYLSSARLDDLLHITVRIEEQGAASMVIAQQAWRGETLLAEGRIRIGCVQAATLKPSRIPETGATGDFRRLRFTAGLRSSHCVFTRGFEESSCNKEEFQ